MMGEMLRPTKIMMIDKDGHELEFEGAITIDEPDNYELTDLDEPMMRPIQTHSVSLQIEKFKPLTRKKYIKMLMSKGIGRNGATEIARYINRKSGRYDVSDLMFW